MGNVNPWKRVAGEAIMDKLEARDVKGDGVVLTVKRAFIQMFGEDEEEALMVEFVEHPNKALRCNKTQGASFRALVVKGKLPDTFDERDGSFGWEGHPVPLFKKEVEYDGKKYLKLYVVAPSLYDEAIESAGVEAKPAHGAKTRSRKK